MGYNIVLMGDFSSLRWFRFMWTDTVVTHSAADCCYGVQEVEQLFYDEAVVEDDRFYVLSV